MIRYKTKQSNPNSLEEKYIDEFFNEISDDEPTRAEIEMLEDWGERCEEFDGACIVCRAWKHFDETGEIA